MDSIPAQTTAAEAAEETVPKKSRRGGSRPGAGRPRLSEDPLDVKVHLRLSAQQRDLLQRLGGIGWLRHLLDGIEKKLDADAKLTPDDIPVEIDGLIAKERTALMMHVVGESAAPAEPASDPQTLGSFDLRPYLYGPNARFDAAYRSRLFAVRVTSDTMIDAGLSMGDIALVDPAQTPKSGELACVNVNGLLLIRRYILEPAASSAAQAAQDALSGVEAVEQPLEEAPQTPSALRTSASGFVPSVEALQAEAAAPKNVLEMRPQTAGGGTAALEAANAALGTRTIYPQPWMKFEILGRVTSVVKPMTTDPIERSAKPAER